MSLNIELLNDGVILEKSNEAVNLAFSECSHFAVLEDEYHGGQNDCNYL